jgi:anti-sigma regulatory factor (Ser/Thr protein kinase)
MSDALWGLCRPPPPGPHATVLGSWAPADAAGLTACRRQLAVALHDGSRGAGTDETAVERLLLAFEELGSNALRHGGQPVRMTLTVDDACWLLEVSDAAAGRPPVPAHDRDPSLGGLGLHLVARICASHGWTTGAGCKTAWACIDRTRDEQSR